MGVYERLESVYRTERDRLFTYALSILGNEESSEDVVHDVFRKLCETPPEATAPWMPCGKTLAPSRR